jgi:hypothetical protein
MHTTVHSLLTIQWIGHIHCKPIPVMTTGFSLCTFPCVGKVHREIPVLVLYWPCTGLQCISITIDKSQMDKNIQLLLQMIWIYFHQVADKHLCQNVLMTP